SASIKSITTIPPKTNHNFIHDTSQSPMTLVVEVEVGLDVSSGGHSEVTNNGRWVEFFFKSTEIKKESMIQTNYPFFNPRKDIEHEEIMHYFEVTVKKMSNQVNTIAIGLSTTPYPYFRLPGYHENSVAYHSDDGRKFHNDSDGGVTYGPTWGKGDTIGCGYRPKNGVVFFTKNGEDLDVAFRVLQHTWYPSIGTDGSCELEVNFGDSDFKFKRARGYGPGSPLLSEHHRSFVALI
ncbi:1436_t:CDS:2, partial [Gigaspora rosea]